MKISLGAKTLAVPTPVWVIGSYDGAGRPNVMTAAWAGICCSRPPCVGVSLRQATYTYGNLMARKAFTVSIPGRAQAAAADFFGMVSGRDVDKFAATGLTAVRSDLVDAPYVKEFPLVLECEAIREVEIGLHTYFIGQIHDVKAEESVLAEDRVLDASKVDPIVFSPEVRRYYGLGPFIGQAFSLGRAFMAG
jgi:flavin reductase (DIM6/NTAB) family NADH-FMN oxidoreductase RutF